MSALIRLKRRIEEDPVNAFIISTKRQKVEGEATEVSSIAQFLGTYSTEVNNVTKLTKAEAKEILSKTPKIVPRIDKTRLQHKLNSQDSRFKLVDLYRTTETDPTGDSVTNITVLEVEKQLDPDEDGKDFVYDYYLGDGNYVPTESNDDIIINPFDDLVFGSMRDNGYPSSDENGTDDSNDENNWRNDYPDTESNSSVDEADMLNAVQRLNIDDDEQSLSSDKSEENDFYSTNEDCDDYDDSKNYYYY